jgi:hypothetical protein
MCDLSYERLKRFCRQFQPFTSSAFWEAAMFLPTAFVRTDKSSRAAWERC